jgi:hypothetical protein
MGATSDVLNALRDRNAIKQVPDMQRVSVCRGCRPIAYAWSLTQGGMIYSEEDPSVLYGNVSSCVSKRPGKHSPVYVLIMNTA